MNNAFASNNNNRKIKLTINFSWRTTLLNGQHLLSKTVFKLETRGRRTSLYMQEQNHTFLYISLLLKWEFLYCLRQFWDNISRTQQRNNMWNLWNWASSNQPKLPWHRRKLWRLEINISKRVRQAIPDVALFTAVCLTAT